MKNFGGLGAWGVFVALIATFAFMFAGPDKDSRKGYEDATVSFTWSTELVPPLIVDDVKVRRQTDALYSRGYALAVESVASIAHSDSIQATSTRRKEVSATVLLLHQYATRERDRDTLGLQRNRYTRHRLI